MSVSKIVTVILLVLLSGRVAAQSTKPVSPTAVPDSIMEKQHSPTKATVMSALLPGLGQVYNKKYWKLPIIYGGLGILTYFIVTNAHDYKMYKDAYVEKADSVYNGKYPDLVSKYSTTDLQSAREYYRRNLEISCLLTALLYILNIVDASVDAHLYTYNINSDLTMKVQPVMMKMGTMPVGSPGIRLCFKF